MSDAADRHPDSQVLAAFIDGADLTSEQVQAIAEHLLHCDDCERVVKEAALFEREQEPRATGGARTAAPWLVATAAAIAVLVAIVAIVRSRQHDIVAELQPRSYRTIAGRVTMFTYAPLRISRSAQQPQDVRRLAIAARLQEELEKDRSAANLHRLGVAQLALGNAAAAQQLLGEAAQKNPSDGAILSDLAAAELATGRTSDAAEHAARALEHDSQLASAAFNAALALEEIVDRETAARAWERYLTLDDRSGWAGEARVHLARLRQPHARWEKDRQRLNAAASDRDLDRLVRAYPQRIRYYVQDELLPHWGAMKSIADIDLAERIGRVRAQTGDPFLVDVVLAARKNPICSGEAFAAFGSARTLASNKQFDRAGSALDDVSRELRRCGSPLALAGAIYAATNNFYLARHDEALEALNTLAREQSSALRRYPCVAAQIEWVRGLIYGATGRPNESLVCFRRAASLAHAAGEIEDEIALNALVSGLLDGIGEPAEADDFRWRTLRALRDTDVTPQREYVAYYQATYAELAAGRPRVALAFNDAQSRIAEQERYPLYEAESAVARALVRRSIGDETLANQSLADAERSIARFDTPGLRDRVEAQVAFLRGELLTRHDPRRAIVSFDDALRIWQRHGWKAHTAMGYLERGEASLAAGNALQAERAFSSGIAEFERERQTLDDPFLRIAYFERSYRLFDQLIDLLIGQRRGIEALEIAERKRARTLLDRITAPVDRVRFPAGAPLGVREIQRRLRPGIGVIEYHIDRDALLIWVIRREDVATVAIHIAGAAMDGAVEGLRSAIDDDDGDAIRRQSRLLFEWLIQPVASQITTLNVLAFVPDGVLHRVPFASLIGRDDRYLVEDHAIVVAPSATAFVGEQRGASVGTILTVAADDTEDAARLPEAAREVEMVTSEWNGAEMLRGEAASPSRFAELAHGARLIHFAGHAVGNWQQPWKSALLFKHDERFDAAAISTLSLEHAPIVVLAACSTAAGTIRHTEGVASIAEAFLHAGARNVAATIWDVDDRASSHLFRVFHERLRNGDAAATAAREAQLAMLHSPDPADRKPFSWAGLVLLGSM